MTMQTAAPQHGIGLLVQPRVLPDSARNPVAAPSPCSEVGWPSNLNSTKPMTVVRVGQDFITGLLRPDPELGSGEVRLVLTTSSAVTWWKGAEIVRQVGSNSIFGRDHAGDEQFEILAGAYTQDGYHGPHTCAPTQLNDYPERSLFLQFRKAGAWGIHTTMYRLPLLLTGGHSLVLNWECDSSLGNL